LLENLLYPVEEVLADDRRMAAREQLTLVDDEPV